MKTAVRPGWSLVKVQAVGVNRSEIFTRQGLSPTVTFPRILGIECVGVVADSTTPLGARVESSGPHGRHGPRI